MARVGKVRRSRIGLALAWALTCACQCKGGTLEANEPQGEGPAVDFGTVVVAQSSPPTAVELQDIGGAPLSVGQGTLTGPNAGDFRITTPFPTDVGAGTSVSAMVVFQPSLSGVRTATLSVQTNGSPALVSIPLSGVGIDLSICSQSAVAFGSVQVLGTPVTQPVSASVQDAIERVLVGPDHLT